MGALFFRQANGGQRVRRLPALGNGDDHVVFADDGFAVAEFGRVFHLHRDPGKALEQVFGDEAGMPTGAAPEDEDAFGLAPYVPVVVNARHG